MSLSFPDANYEHATGIFADVTPYDLTPRPNRAVAHLLAQHLSGKCIDTHECADVHYLDP